MMPLSRILIVEIFDVWGIDFVGPLTTCFGLVYILVIVGYVSKWIEALVTKTDDYKVMVRFVEEYIVSISMGRQELLLMMEVVIFVTDLFRLCL